MTKSERQEIGVQKIKNNNFNGLLVYATGFGKSWTAMLIIKEYLIVNPDAVINIVVPSIKLKNQWVSDYTFSYPNIKVYVINSYVSINRKCDLLIVDEIHKVSNIDSEHFSKIFERTIYSNCIGLSATLDKEKLNYLSNFNLKIIDYIPLEVCIQNNWLSDYVEYNVGLELNEENRIYYEKLNSMFKSYFSVFGHDFNVLKYCANKDYLNQYCQNNNLDVKEVQFKQFRTMQIVGQRSQFIYNNLQKMEAASLIIDKYYKSNKILVFGQSIEVNQKLESKNTNLLVRYDSKCKKKVKIENLNSFEEGDVNCLITAKSLDEGYDNENINIAIIMSGTSKDLQHTQRIGRILRFNELSKNRILFNVYIKNSKDEDWLKLRQKNNKKVIWINELELKKLLDDKC